MRSIVNMHDAKTNLSKLVARAERGEEIEIGSAGVPRARLVPLHDSRHRERRPRFGTAKGTVWIAPDFDEPIDFETYSEPASGRDA